MRPIFVTALSLVLTCGSAAALAQNPVSREEILAALHNDALMSPEEQAREAERQPADVLTFFRLRSDMKVMELLPFSGWYSKVLAQLLDEGGKRYVTQPEVPRYSDQMRE